MSEVFPTETFPQTIRQFVEACAETLPCSAAMIALPVIVTLGAAIGTSHRIRIKPDWEESSAIYGAMVAETGSMKSPALKLATEPLRSTDQSKRRTWTQDTTVERFAQLLHANPRGLLVYRDELTGWVRSMNQYKRGKGADREFYLEAWGGSPCAVDRKDLHLSIPCPFVAVVGCVPPALLPVLTEGSCQEEGFIQRLLFVRPQSVPVRLRRTEISLPIHQGYESVIQTLLELDGQAGHTKMLELSAEAWDNFQQWHDAHCKAMECPALPAKLKGFYSKHKGYCARLALIHAVASDPDTELIPVESVQAAIAQIEYFKAQAQRIVELMGPGVGTVGNPEQAVLKCRAEILRRFLGGKRLTRRDAQRNTNCAKEVFQLAWDSLTQGPLLVDDPDGMVRHRDFPFVSIQQSESTSSPSGDMVTDIPTTDNAA